MPIPEFPKFRKFPVEQALGGGRPHNPPTVKGQGPQTGMVTQFGKGLESQDRPYNPPIIKGQGAQRLTKEHRFGQDLDAPDRPFNPITPKPGKGG